MRAPSGVGKHPRQRRDYKIGNVSVETGLAPSHRRYTGTDAPNAALSLELHPGPPDCSVAQSLSAMADRDLHRRQNDPDRIPGILGILVDRAKQLVAVLEMDSGNGSLRPSEEQQLAFST